MDDEHHFDLEHVAREVEAIFSARGSMLTAGLEVIGTRVLDHDRFAVVYRYLGSPDEYGIVLSASELAHQYERPESERHLAELAVDEVAEPSGPLFSTTSPIAGDLTERPERIRWRGLDPDAPGVTELNAVQHPASSIDTGRYSAGWTKDQGQ